MPNWPPFWAIGILSLRNLHTDQGNLWRKQLVHIQGEPTIYKHSERGSATARLRLGYGSFAARLLAGGAGSTAAELQPGDRSVAGSVAGSAARGELVEARRDEYGDSGDGSDGSDGSDEPEAKMRARPTCLPGPSRLKVLSQCWLPR